MSTSYLDLNGLGYLWGKAKDKFASKDISATDIEAVGISTVENEGNPVVISDVPYEQEAEDVIVEFEPIQDLHGYDHPWPEGGGVNNLLQSDTNYSNTVYGLTAIYDAETETCMLSGTNTDSAAAHVVLTRNPSNGLKVSADLKPGDIFWFGGIVPTNAYIQIIYKKTESGSLVALKWIDGNGAFKVSIGTVPDDFDSIVRFDIGCNPGASVTGGVKAMLSIGQAQPTEWTPYSNICSISGRTGVEVVRCGKNLIDTVGRPIVTTVSVVNAIFANNCTVIKAGDALVCTGIRDWAKVRYAFDPSFFKPGKTYTVSAHLDNPNGLKVGMCLRKNRSWSNVITSSNAIVDVNIICTVTDDDSLTEIALIINDTGTSVSGTVTINNIQLEIGSTATPYEPYQAESYDIAFPSEAGTVYGGTLDVKSGVLTVDRAKCLIRDLVWSYVQTYNRMSSESIKSMVETPPSNAYPLNGLLCSAYRTGAATETGSAPINGTIAVSANLDLLIRDESFQSAETFLANMGDQTIIYPLATPITYQLTPHQLTLLKKYNYIMSSDNNSNIIVTYDGKSDSTIQSELDELNETIFMIKQSISNSQIDNMFDALNE